ncbi:MAG: protein kinase domain-containing protein [Candidatus Xenobia bacterium]
MRRILLLWLLLALPIGAAPLSQEAPVLVVTAPAGARVYDAGMFDERQGYLGTTPVTLLLQADRTHVLRLQKPGYQDARVRVELGQQEVRCTLTRVPVVWPWWWSLPVLLAGLAAVRRDRKRPQSPADPVRWAVGAEVDSYRIVELVAEGAFAWVWRAEHESYHETVALKMLKPAFVDPEARRHLAREMEIGRDLRHPNLVRVYAFGEYRGMPYLVQELVDGVPLHPTDARTLVDLAAGICDGLQAAHEHGVIHRDLKPDNILVGRDGRPRIMDFGIARMLDRKRVTASGAVIGTPWYMSPEQSRNQMDTRSDLYSLGVILYQMLSGHVPFDSQDPVMVMAAHRRQAPPPLPDGVPPALAAIVMQLLEKDPDRRPQTAAGLAADLRALRL